MTADVAATLPHLAATTSGPTGAPWTTFIPGIGNDATFWAAQAAGLADAHQVLLFDPWGCGRSAPAPEDLTIDIVADGIVALWDESGIERSAVVGLGFGGSVALNLALRHPARVTTLVAFCCRARQPDDRRQFWRDRQAHARSHGLDDLASVTVSRWLGAFGAEHPAVLADLQAAFLRSSTEGYCAYVEAFARMDMEPDLVPLRLPAVLVAAEHDHGGGPVAAMRQLAEALQVPLQVIPGSGHIVNHEKPAEVTALLRAHL